MKKLLLPCFLLLSGFIAPRFSGFAATCISTGTGNWETIGTWSCGHVPTCGDSIVIQAGHTVTITSQIDLTGCGSPLKLTISGTLNFQNGKKIDFPCGSRVYIMPGGQITGGGGGGSSNLITICSATVWSSGSGTASGPDCFPPTDPVCGAFLPIKLLYFKAAVCNADVCLNWATATETNNDYFTIERSPDGKTISTVGTLAGAGTTSVLHTYSLIDDSPLQGTSYYRLKQTDFDGSSTYSYWVAVSMDFSIYPNPTSGDLFYVDVPPAYIGQALEVNVYDVLGKRVYSASFGAATPVVAIRPGSTLRQGIYQVSLISAAGPRTYRQKLVIQ